MQLRFLRTLTLLIAVQLFGCASQAQTLVDVAIGKHNGCALYDDGAVWCWGAEILPDLPGVPPLPMTATRIENLGFARSISVGRLDACAVLDDSSAWCWGTDFQASTREQKQVHSWKPVRVDGLPPVKMVSIGYVHHCALAADGGVWCWGFNPLGELGDGTSDNSWKPRKVDGIGPAIAIGAGVNKSCAVMTVGDLMCWGTYDPTQDLALGAPWAGVLNSKRPVMLPVKDLISVENGRNFGCGILRTGGVACWGSNVMKQLGTLDRMLTNADPIGGFGVVAGLSGVTDLDVDYFHACAVANGTGWCWGMSYEAPDLDVPPPDEGSGLLPYMVPGLSGATKVGTGESHSCAIAGKEVLCWGWKSVTEDILPGMSPTTPVPVPKLPKSP